MFNLLYPTAVSSESNIDDIELSLLLEAIYCRWGYDFRNYARGSLKRRVWKVVENERLSSISGLQERILRDSFYMQRFLDQVSVGYTSMFRDPSFYQAFRRIAIPLLQEYQLLRIWHIGCASGEEVYSMAILLSEENLLERTRIYATDMNPRFLEIARQGVYSVNKMKEYTKNYQQAGGKASFSEYYHADKGQVQIRPDFAKNIVWALHNLVTDSSFNEFHLILCRNVLLYFNDLMQARIHHLINESLIIPNGLLVLGRQEFLPLTASNYISLDAEEKIYQKIH